MEPTEEAGVGTGSGTASVLGPVVQIDEGRIQAHLDTTILHAKLLSRASSSSVCEK